MYDLDAIEAINLDPLITATDRLLLRAHRQRRLQTRRSFDLSRAAALAIAASRDRARASEKTVFVRSARLDRELLAAAAAVAATAWLLVTLACLLV